MYLVNSKICSTKSAVLDRALPWESDSVNHVTLSLLPWTTTVADPHVPVTWILRSDIMAIETPVPVSALPIVSQRTDHVSAQGLTLVVTGVIVAIF